MVDKASAIPAGMGRSDARSANPIATRKATSRVICWSLRPCMTVKLPSVKMPLRVACAHNGSDQRSTRSHSGTRATVSKSKTREIRFAQSQTADAWWAQGKR